MKLTPRNADPARLQQTGTRHTVRFRSVSRRYRVLLVTLVATLMQGGCAQVGPQVLIEGRAQYNIAVQQTEAQQLLLNIVRNRYSDTILFLDITSITSGFSRGMNAGLLGSFSSGSNSGIANVGGDIRENPNVFYAPNTGEKFVRQMLTPIDLRTVALLLQSGWSIERLMLLLGESANELYNRPIDDDTTQPDDEFFRLADSLRNLQRDHQLVVGLEPTENESEVTLVVKIATAAVETPDYLVVCKALGVACDGEPLRLRQGFGAPTDDKTLALATRSLFSVIYHLSRHVDAPAEHVAAGYASSSKDLADVASTTGDSLRQLFHVRSSADEPEHAAVKIFYRDTWFYIADSDQDSKTTFALLSMLITLKSGDTSGIMPLITIPSG